MGSSHPNGPAGLANLTQIAEFDEVIDVRSPSEYADDHLPGAISCPVLDDAERARVGTLYKQESPFAAKKVGAALVAHNIARHIEAHLLDKPRNWRPLIYCWRGGQRSGAFTHILRQIGWDACRLEGGYKNWRRHVIEQLTLLPARQNFRVISGPTGSGKSRLLEALAAQGAQVLHLEALAAHKGSVLGTLPDEPQPTQRSFESRLYTALSALDPQQPVFVEAESRRIGLRQLPDELLSALRQAPGIRIEADTAARVDFLLRDYDYFLTHPAWLVERLDYLRGLQANETLERWKHLIEMRDFSTLVNELLERHYDPLYRRSQLKSRVATESGPTYSTGNLSPADLTRLARQLREQIMPPHQSAQSHA